MSNPPIINVEHLTFSYGSHKVLDDISIQFNHHEIIAITGASGKGKSTFLMVLNRLWEGIPQAVMTGTVQIFSGSAYTDIYASSTDKFMLRRNIGMVFQKPNPLPMSIMKNITFPLKLKGEKNKKENIEKAIIALRKACLWEEVKDRLYKDARQLSGGQQQRLCIARALVLEPAILLLDEPTSSLDARSVDVIENLLIDLKQQCTILMVTHYRDQVKRISNRHVEINDGKIWEKNRSK